MFLREKVLSIACLVVMALLLGGTTAFPQYSLAVKDNDIELKEKSVDTKAIREMEERGLDFARKAMVDSDFYPGKKTEAKIKNDELVKLVEKKKDLAIRIQRLQIGMRKEKAKFALNPQLLKVTVKQYTQKIKELEDELVEVEKQIPALESELANVNIELKVEELSRGIKVDEEDNGDFDEEFEKAKEERWKRGKGLVKTGSLSTLRFRH